MSNCTSGIDKPVRRLPADKWTRYGPQLCRDEIDPGKLYTLRDYCRAFGVNLATARRHRASGRFATAQTPAGSGYLIPGSELLRLWSRPAEGNHEGQAPKATETAKQRGDRAKKAADSFRA